MGLSSDTTNIDKNFNSFLELFSKDTTFQLSRIVFPFQVKQYDVMNDKDTVFYRKRVGFEIMDFREKQKASEHDEWKQEVVIDKNNLKATIEVRGIDNGIVVDYIFEKRKGRWMFVGIVDSST